MLWIKKLIVFTLLTVALPAHTKDESEKLKEVALNYQRGFDLQKKDLIKKVTTKKYYQELTNNKLLDRLFQVNKIEKEKKYQVEVIQSKVVKGMIIAKIIDSEDKDHAKTIKIKKTEDGYKVDSHIHMDE
tara:strand:+ start:46117 stop:46506 length:390 start_codon:yes stop_codon:yes gene_type:complete